MKLKTSVVAVIFGLSTTALWAADSVQNPDDESKAQAASSAASTDTGNTGEEQAGWRYLNGQVTASTAEESAGGNDQAGNAEDAGEGDQSAASDDAGDGDQSADAKDSAANDQTGNAEIHPGNFRAASLEDFKAATQDKLVVILPVGWQGSVPHLIAALEDDSNASEILILSQDDDSAESQDDSADSQ